MGLCVYLELLEVRIHNLFAAIGTLEAITISLAFSLCYIAH